MSWFHVSVGASAAGRRAARIERARKDRRTGRRSAATSALSKLRRLLARHRGR